MTFDNLENEEILGTEEQEEDGEDGTIELEGEDDDVTSELDKPKKEESKQSRTIEKLTKTLHLTVIGNTDLIAESKILLAGFKPGIPTVWVITKSEHSLDSSGFKTTIEAKEILTKGE